MSDEELFTILTPPEKTNPGEANDAPYGHKPDGTPYKRRPSGPRGPRKAKAADSDKAVIDAVTTIWGVIVTVLSTLARAFKSTPLMADAIVVNKAAPKTIPPLTEIIKKNDRLVAMCVQLAVITPGFELASALLPLIGQLVANHGMVPGAEGQAEAIVRAYEKELGDPEPEEQERRQPRFEPTPEQKEPLRWVAHMSDDELREKTGMTKEEWDSAQFGNVDEEYPGG